MVTVKVDPDIFTKLPPVLVAKAAKKLAETVSGRRFRAGQKWQENVYVDGNRIGLGCHYVREEDRVDVTAARPLLGKKGVRARDR